MTREDIIRMAHEVESEVGFKWCVNFIELERFSALVAAHTLSNIDPSKFMSHQEGVDAGRLAEREACAKVCDGLADTHAKMNQWSSHKTADTLAQAIRARGNI
jgi:hypothetical protein